LEAPQLNLKKTNIEKKDKILVLGGSSFVGKALSARIPPEQKIQTYFNRPIKGGVYFDACSMSPDEILPEPETISHGIVLLGDTKPDSCFTNPDRSRLLNVESIINILKCFQRYEIIPVFSSTEVVFDGSKGNYSETDNPGPTMLYAKQKLEVESFIQQYFQEHIILRLALVLSDTPGDGSFLPGLLENIVNRKSIHGASDYISTPVYVNDACEVLMCLIRNKSRGIFHVSGTEILSRLDISNMLAETLRKHMKISADIIPCKMADFALKEERPLNVSLCNKKLLKATGITLTPVQSVCENLVRKYNG
jgi:dTDP-4-dehydrorhamnose reductase